MVPDCCDQASCARLLEQSAKQLNNQSWVIQEFANSSHDLPNVLAAGI